VAHHNSQTMFNFAQDPIVGIRGPHHGP
jgi:hypothetical protein